MLETDDTAELKRLLAERRYGDAIVACRQMLLGTESPAVRLLLGQALLAEERFDDVRAEMLNLTRVDPALAGAHRMLGEAYLRSGQKDKAEEALRQALTLDPGDSMAKELLEEAEGEKFPVAQTIERWFGDDEGRTVETETPAFVEESTPVPGPLPPGSLPIEPSIQIDPSLTAEAERLQSELSKPSFEAGDAADSTMPGPPPPRGEGLRALLQRAVPKPVPKPIVVAPRSGPAGPTPIGSAPTGPPPTAAPPMVAPPTGAAPTVAAPTAAPRAAAPRAGAPGSSALPPPPSRPQSASTSPPRAKAPPSAPPPPASARPSAPKSQAPLVPPPGALDLDPPTTELALPELEDDESTEVPAPLADSDELELTRPLPPISALDLADPNVTSPLMRQGPAPNGPKAGPPSTRPPAHHDPRALPSFGPANPLPALGAAPIAPVPVPPVSPGAALQITAPEIQLSGAAAVPPRIRDTPIVPLVPPTAAHVPQRTGFDAPPEVARAPLDRRKVALAAGVGGVLLLGLIVTVASSGPSALDEAMVVASNDGRPASYEAALALAPADGSGRERATRALLLATTSLELGLDHAAEVDQLLATLEGEDTALPEARIARSLASLLRGQGGQALTVLSGLSATGVILVEGFRARALSLAQVGTPSEAVDAARQAATLAPGAPRHAALFAELLLASGDAEGASRVLDGTVGIDGIAGLRVVRAELGLFRGGDVARITGDIDAVIGPLTTAATGPEIGRARLARARLALARSDEEAARADLELASTLIPVYDERRRLLLADGFLAAEAPARALVIASALTAETADVPHRAEVVVRAALASGDAVAAERAVALAGAGPRIDLLRAQIAEANGNADQARSLYALAAADPALIVPGRTAEGRLYLAAGRPREAVVALSQALMASPTAPLAVLYFTRASLAVGDINAAERATTAAAGGEGSAPEILAASALVARARGRFDVAYGLLERATAARPTDAALLIDQGDVALCLARLDDAARVYQQAAILVPSSPLAPLRLAMLAIERGDLDGAAAQLGTATTGPEPERSQARGALLVARGAGRSGIEELNTLRNGRTADPTLAAQLAALYVQAEDDRTARRFVATALRGDRDMPEALVLSAMIDAHEGRSGNASRSLDAAERSAAARGSPPSVRARILAVRARLLFDDSELTAARRDADEALRLDPRCAEAHLVIADLETLAQRDPIPALRAAASGTSPLGEVFGRLAIRLDASPEACTLGRRFLEVAPAGYDAREVRDVLASCP